MSNPPGQCEPTLDTALLAVTFGFVTWPRDTIISDGHSGADRIPARIPAGPCPGRPAAPYAVASANRVPAILSPNFCEIPNRICDADSVTMNNFGYIIFCVYVMDERLGRGEWVLSRPRVLLQEHCSDDEVFPWLRLRT